MLLSGNTTIGLLTVGTDNKIINKLIGIFGYVYDSEQDIFYSAMDAWQRKAGFCRLYDEIGAPLSMIMDCEPIYFKYHGEKWLVEFWKGQYGMVTGGEIGVYTGGVDLKILGIFNDTFYTCADDDDMLEMSYILRKNDRVLFTRKGKHWWLTGFKLGEFSEPSQLSMDISITFKDADMRDAFLSGFREAGYTDDIFLITGNTLNFTFDTPRTAQPRTRTRATDWIVQRKNELLCNIYQELMEHHYTMQERIQAARNEIIKGRY